MDYVKLQGKLCQIRPSLFPRTVSILAVMQKVFFRNSIICAVKYCSISALFHRKINVVPSKFILFYRLFISHSLIMRMQICAVTCEQYSWSPKYMCDIFE